MLTQRGTKRPTLIYLLTYSLEYLPTYLITYMDIHLLVCLHTHMLTLRAPRTLQVLTCLLPTHPTTYLFTYLYADARSALHPTLTYLHTNSLTSLLTYLLTYLPTYFLTCLPTYLLAVAARDPALHIYLLTHLCTYKLIYLLTCRRRVRPSLHTY